MIRSLSRALLVPVALVALSSGLALAQDEGSTNDLGIDDIMKDINLDGPGAEEISYGGQLSDNAPSFKEGLPITISHSGGTITVRCMDEQGMTARLAYTIWGNNSANMERMGKSIGLDAGSDGKTGWVRTRIPAKSSGVSRADIPLTVNLPKSAKITVTGGAGWVQIQDCAGTVKSSNGVDGAYVSGTYTSVNVSAGKGDVKVELSDGSVLAGANSVSAPGGSAVLRLPLSYAGKFSAKASSVTVFHTVAGTNTDTLVQGTVGTGTASLNISAKEKVEVTAPR